MNLFADFLFTGGPVYTANLAGSKWAEAVAVRDGRILAVGRAQDLEELRGPKTEVVDLAGRLLVPGFTESHIHFIELALRSTQVEATDACSASEVAERVRAKLVATGLGGTSRTASGGGGGRWLRGGGWNVHIWTDGVLPHRRILDAVAPDVPVALDSKELHAVWVNSAALRLAGITAATPETPGGVIERDPDGEPTGILRENAVELVAHLYPKPSLAETSDAAVAATPGMWAAGIVAMHNANDTCDGLALRTYQALHRQGALGLRVLQQIPVCNLGHATALGLRSGLGDAWLRIGGVKIFADGALGSRTASMLQPYVGEPANWGVPTCDPEEMLEQALAASAAGLSLTIHAIGDRANRDVLNVLAEVRRQEANAVGQPRAKRMATGELPSESSRRPTALRHRIEHVQCIHPADLPRLAELDVLASVQPIHATSDMLIADRYWGTERAPGAYAFRSLLNSGAHLVFGSDGPIEPYAPLVGIHAAVTRRRGDGTPGPAGWQPQERITVAEAVDAYTYWPAYAAGEERYRGSIAAGKVADLVVLAKNIFEIEPMQTRDVPVILTMLDGVPVWRSE